MRHPSKHRFFSHFLVPDRQYSDSAAGTFWTANRFTKTRTFQNFSKHATWKTHAKSQHTAEFGKKTARIRGRLVHKSWSFEKLSQVREIVPNRNKTLRFFAWKKWTQVMRARRCGLFLQARRNPKMTTKNEQKKCIQQLQIACNFGNWIPKIRCVLFFSFYSFVLASFHFVSFRFVRRPTGLIHPNTRLPAPAACTGILLLRVAHVNLVVSTC